MTENEINNAACYFLRWGCIGKGLRRELVNFCRWCERIKIQHPETLFERWNIFQNNIIDINTGERIADFISVSRLHEIDIISSIEDIYTSNGAMYISYTADTRQQAQEIGESLDNKLCQNADFLQYMKNNKAGKLFYTWRKPEQTKRTRAINENK